MPQLPGDGCGGCFVPICCRCFDGMHHSPSRTSQRAKDRGPANEGEFRRRIDFLKEVPLFKRLPRSQYPVLARVLRARRWQTGEIVLEDGAPLSEFFLIAHGYAEVQLIEGGRLISDTLRPGDYFGEKLLEQGSAPCSSARIEASFGLVTLSLSAEEFEECGLRKHLRFPRRQGFGRGEEGGAVGSSSVPTLPKAAKAKMTPEQRQLLAEAVRANTNLRSLINLREQTVQQMCEVAERREVSAGTAVARRGEFNGMLFIVESGSFELLLDDEPGPPQRTCSSMEQVTTAMRRKMNKREQFLQELSHSQDFAANDSDPGSWSPRTPRTPSRTPRRNSTPRSQTSGHLGVSQRRARAHAGAPGCSSMGTTSPHIIVLPILEGPHEGELSSHDNSPKQASKTHLLLPQAKEEERSRKSSRGADSDSSVRRFVSESWPVENTSTPSKSFGDDVSPPTPRRGASEGVMTLGSSPASMRERDDSSVIQLAKLNCGVLGVRCQGSSFGELSLLYRAPRTSTAVAREESVVWCVSQAMFRKIMVNTHQDRIERVVRHLDQVDLFEGLLSQEKLELAQNFLSLTFHSGDCIVHQGERLNVWYMLVQGECRMTHIVNGKEEELAILRPTEYFGERALLLDRPSDFTVKVSSEEDARCLVLDGPTFSELAGLLRNDESFRHAIEDDLLNFAKYKGSHNPKLVGFLHRLREVRSSQKLLDSFQMQLKLDPTVDTRALDRVGVLGTGAFGIVTLERDPTTGQLFALKMLSKGLIAQNKLQENVNHEREIMSMIESPFTMRLHATFKDKNYIYFLLEPLLGGDLHTHMHRDMAIFRSAPVYKFVLACMTCALGHLHERNIVFRDLKPENILLDSNGYAKLCDYGFAKFVLGRTMTLCGTPEYVAPEVIGLGGYDRMVDWWALGVLTYELIAGRTPFEEDDQDQTSPVAVFRNVKAGIEEVSFPFREPDAVSLIKRLLNQNPARRLGIGGPSEVKRHKFLTCINFQALERQEVAPPYVPELAGEDDLGMFHPEEQETPPFVEYEDDGSAWDSLF